MSDKYFVTFDFAAAARPSAAAMFVTMFAAKKAVGGQLSAIGFQIRTQTESGE